MAKVLQWSLRRVVQMVVCILLNRFDLFLVIKFQSNRGGGVKKYLLSKELVKKVIDLYFNTEITPHNNTNNTKQHKQHTLTPENNENVGLGGVCGITPLWKGEEKNDTIDFNELDLGGSENE